jgi:amidophosphoribosyltransferase
VIREVKPGEIVTLSNTTLRTRQALPPAPKLARCVFEHIYFSRPDSFWDGLNVHQIRQRLGEELFREAAVPAEVIVPVPDSSVPAAIGYARASGIPYNDGFIKNRYIGRTFIQPTDSLRKQGVALKYNALDQNVRGMRVVMIDDSIVRGNTAGPLVKLLREAGAREVHVRICCPPIAHPCYMGVDMGVYDDLIAHRLTLEEMRDHIDCDSLHFLSLEGMMRAVGRNEGYCNACFTGLYPIEIDFGHTKTGFERAIR